ncbi:MAG: ribose 5-phosphate isomerase B [Anaerolineae bacterium]
MPTDDELRATVRDLVLRILQEHGIHAPPPRGVAIGADHGGFELKQNLVPYLSQLGYRVTDCGTFTPDPVDYPDIAYAVARLVGEGTVAHGIIIDGAGIGSCMAANKVPGVRAAMCYDTTTARNAREHNDANVLTLGGRLITASVACDIVRTFLETSCTEPRHQKRVQKILDIERRYLRR